MVTERTFIILKPDALEKKLEFEILERIQKKGFSIVELKKIMSADPEILKEHYKVVLDKRGPEIYNSVIDYLTMGPIIIAIVEGNNAVDEIRLFGGDKTAPMECDIGTIRRDYSIDSYDLAKEENRAVMNMIHTSDSKETAKKEIALWFGNDNLEYQLQSHENILDTMGMNKLMRDFIDTSNINKILYHGVKNSAIDDIISEGIKPLTPESGPCSFWSTGSALFEPQEDSPFFNYSGSSKPDICELLLAVTDIDTLSQHGFDKVDYKQDSQITLDKTVPFEAISLINVKLKHPKTEFTRELREYRKHAEQILFAAICAEVYGGLRPGNVKKHYREVNI